MNGDSNQWIGTLPHVQTLMKNLLKVGNGGWWQDT